MRETLRETEKKEMEEREIEKKRDCLTETERYRTIERETERLEQERERERQRDKRREREEEKGDAIEPLLIFRWLCRPNSSRTLPHNEKIKLLHFLMFCFLT